MGIVFMVEVLNRYLRWGPICYLAFPAARCVVAEQVHCSLLVGLQIAVC